MNRRRLIVGAGALLGGAGTTLGTGAFTSTSADRHATVAVANEDEAYLTIEPSVGEHNGGFATQNTSNGKEIGLDFDDIAGTTAGSEGVGPDSTYEFDDVFRVRNSGAQKVFLDVDTVTIQFSGTADLEFVAGTARETIDGSNAELAVPAGQERAVGVRVETNDGSTYDDVNAPDDTDQASAKTTLTADDTLASGATEVDPGSPSGGPIISP
jgi:hypothetical protein